MTSTQFSGFWTPSPPCLHFGKIHSTKSTQPPLLRLHFINPPSPLSVDVIYVWPLTNSLLQVCTLKVRTFLMESRLSTFY